MNSILFEPWNLGDSLIAASVAFQDPARITLACNSRWHRLIQLASPSDTTSLELLSVDLDYINRSRGNRLSFGNLPTYRRRERVLSIRGDLRDYWVAKKIFPDAHVRMRGWLPFFARRSLFLDLPFQMGLLPVRNRYRAWAHIAGVDFARIEAFYRRTKSTLPKGPCISLHVGAQWRAKQFPGVLELKTALEKLGREVRLIAGPNDPLPPGIDESQVSRLVDQHLVDAFQKSEQVLTNDSGPMHLAALLGCKTCVISRVSSIHEWLPPGATAVSSLVSPKGYRPDGNYCSDAILGHWPSITEILENILKQTSE